METRAMAGESGKTLGGPITIEDRGEGVVRVTLARPETFNALSHEMMAALRQTIADAEADAATRVLILAGSGKAFSAGHDLKELRGTNDPARLLALFEECSDLMQAITRSPKPVIAEVNGVATAAGCQLVASCDLAVATEASRFAVSGVNLGLFCATPMVALTRALPRKQAMEMLLTGDFIDAATALRYGLVNRVVPADELEGQVMGLARKIAGKSLAALAFGKRLFHRQLDAPLDAAYRMACETMVANLGTEDARAGIDGFIAKQPPPRWQDR